MRTGSDWGVYKWGSTSDSVPAPMGCTGPHFLLVGCLSVRGYWRGPAG